MLQDLQFYSTTKASLDAYWAKPANKVHNLYMQQMSRHTNVCHTLFLKSFIQKFITEITECIKNNQCYTSKIVQVLLSFLNLQIIFYIYAIFSLISY